MGTPKRWTRIARTVAEYAVTIGAGILASYLIVHVTVLGGKLSVPTMAAPSVLPAELICVAESRRRRACLIRSQAKRAPGQRDGSRSLWERSGTS